MMWLFRKVAVMSKVGLTNGEIAFMCSQNDRNDRNHPIGNIQDVYYKPYETIWLWKCWSRLLAMTIVFEHYCAAAAAVSIRQFHCIVFRSYCEFLLIFLLHVCIGIVKILKNFNYKFLVVFPGFHGCKRFHLYSHHFSENSRLVHQIHVFFSPQTDAYYCMFVMCDIM